ncbi:hypothetical protein SAMN02745121_07930 [Nannocystis exedens]|uniref:Uncharacterized protein n=1 Tax=Nannocystis exedens TaxID=54 RepID=A0A1I2HE53_9BACT|nr:hypothetical protein [Nannocystis exedens]PCC70402.1 hypothetical protein NAEX_03445 [Nannocystis exedens]SFF28535.1 hypothetical protein SAMN02745121_07930 [Nannocystis exedens]
MTLPALKSVALHKRLQSFEAHHGSLLAEVLHELAQEAAREPRNLIASTTYNNALVLAGKAREARAEAARGFELWRSLPAVSPEISLNLAAGLGDAGLVVQAKRVLASLDERALGELDAARVEIAAQIAVRHGELEWFAARRPDHPMLEFLARHELVEGWQARQSAIEAALGERVSSFGASIVGIDGVHDRLALYYWTDADSYAEIDQLQDQLLDVLEGVPGGSSHLIGRVVFTVYGPEIPLEELRP